MENLKEYLAENKERIAEYLAQNNEQIKEFLRQNNERVKEYLAGIEIENLANYYGKPQA